MHGKKATRGCQCGFLGDPARECACPLPAVQRYRARISGPLLDRIDIQIEVPAVTFRALADRATGATSDQLRARVVAARARQLERFRGRTVYANAQMTSRDLRASCQLDGRGEQLLEQAMQKLGLSARAYARILKVARTIADLDGSDALRPAHVAEAIQYRSFDRALR